MAEAEIPTEDHEALVNWARRQQRLTASISEFAVAITSIRDDGSALQQLVSRTRTLLDVDMAYISLNGTDGSGFTHIVETEGVFTEEYRKLRMPLGAGVLGRVAQAGGPVQTVSYEGDDLIVHDSEVDRIVAAEGVEAILGAPMRSGGRVVGALMAANRYRHRFTAEQVSLAQTLANLAAVAIENSTRLEQLTMSVQSLRSRSVEAERQLQIERRLTSADEALMDAIVTGGELAELRAGMSSAIGRDVKLVDLTVRYDLRSDAAEIGDEERPLFVLSARTDSPMLHQRDDGTNAVVMAAVREDELVGGVMVDGEVSGGDELVLRRCAKVLGAFLSARSRERGDIVRRRRELLEHVLGPGPGGISDAATRQLGELGVRAGEPFRILVADGSEAPLRDFEHRLELDFGTTLLHATLDGQFVAIIPEAAFATIREGLEGRGARRWGRMLVGHSPELHAFDIVPEEFALVLRVIEAARRSGDTRTVVSLASYGAIGAFLSKVTIEPTRRAIEQFIGPLRAYDAEHESNLIETAGAYLDAGRSVAQAARALHVHENTIRQRLDRIAALLGRDWSVGQRGLDTHIMLAANRLVGD